MTLRESLPTDLGFGVKFGGPKWVPGLTTPDPCVPDTGFRALNGLDIGYPLLVIAPQAIYVSDPPDHSPQDPLIVVSDPSKMGHFGGPKWGKIPRIWVYFGPILGYLLDPVPGVWPPANRWPAGCRLGAVRPLACPPDICVSLGRSMSGSPLDLDPKRGHRSGAWVGFDHSEREISEYFLIRTNPAQTGNKRTTWLIWPVWI